MIDIVSLGFIFLQIKPKRLLDIFSCHVSQGVCTFPDGVVRMLYSVSWNPRDFVPSPMLKAQRRHAKEPECLIGLQNRGLLFWGFLIIYI